MITCSHLNIADEKCDMIKNVSHQNHGKYNTKYILAKKKERRFTD